MTGPGDRADPGDSTGSSGAAAAQIQQVEIDEADTAALRAAAERCGATLSTALQVAWGLALRTMTGRSDVVFGARVAGRPAEVNGSRPAVGSRADTVPTIVSFADDPTVATLVQRLQGQHAGPPGHQHVAPAASPGGAGHQPLLDTLLVHEIHRRDGERSGFAAVRPDATGHPLTVVVRPGDRIAVQVAHDPGALDRDRVRRCVQAFLQAVARIGADPDARCSLLDLRGVEDRELVACWSAGPTVALEPLPVEDLVRRQAAIHPNALVVVGDGGQALSYLELYVLVATYATALRALGVQVGDRVVLHAERSAEALALGLAVLRVGGVLVPVDPAWPAARTRFVLADAAPRLVVDERWLRARAGGPVEPGAPARPVSAADGAYLVYADTAWRPRGVLVSHAAIGNLIGWRQAVFPLGPGDRVLAKTAPGADPSLAELWWPLAVGAVVRLVRPGGERDLDYLLGLLRTERIGFVQLAPGVATALLDAGWEPAGVTHLALGGGVVPPALAARLAGSGTNVWHTYGTTEAAVQCTGFALCAGAEGPVPIGAPVWNTVVRVLDRWLLQVPVGVVGELYVAGAQLAYGYPGQHGSTASRFVADPFAADGGRLYRTGELVRWNEFGELDHLGRVDDQDGIRGDRMAPGEVAGVLSPGC